MIDNAAKIVVPWPGRVIPPASSQYSRSKHSGRRYAIVSWLSLIGVLLPSKELYIDAGVNFTPGRICVILLFFPALFSLLGNAYRFVWADLFAVATTAWIVIAAVSVNGSEALLSAAGGESLEFFGAYMIGRAYFGQESALRKFIQVLTILTSILLLFAIADRISGRWIIQDTLASLTNTVAPGTNYREGVIRATATLDHPILLGAFFALSTALFIYSSGSALRRTACVVGCLFGCFLSLSSAALMSSLMIIGSYFYEQLLKNYPWRWGLFWAVTGIFLGVIFLVANAPLGWLITHLTLDPESGYFRYLIWNSAFERIPDSPFVGFAFNRLNNGILDVTVDSVWLAYALRFGLPMIAFFFLTNIAAIWPSGKGRADHGTAFMVRLNTGLTVMLLIFMFIGLTVHFWNFMWIFWGLCLGIKASLKQQLAQ